MPESDKTQNQPDNSLTGASGGLLKDQGASIATIYRFNSRSFS